MIALAFLRRPFWLSGLGVALPVALAYAAASALGLLFLAGPGTVALFWPAAGLGIALFLRLPRLSWPACGLGLAVGNAAANLMVGQGVLPTLGFAAVNVVEPLLAVLVVGRLFGRTMRGVTSGEVLRVVLAAVGLVQGPAALLGALATGSWSVEAGSLWVAWRAWFLADAVGTLTVAPLVLALWSAHVRERPAPRTLVEWLAMGGALAGLTAMTFGPAPGPAPLALAALVPLLLLAIARLPRAGAALVAVVVPCAAAWGTLGGQGPFVLPDAAPQDALLAVQLFGGLLALAALVGRRSRAEPVIRREPGPTAGGRTEAETELLLREMSHRSKNLLSVVQAVARQTARRSNPERFADLFFLRLAALSASHDLLVRGDWRHVDLRSLVLSQLAHFADLAGNRVTLAGPPLRLTPGAAQAVGMALHELATNAGKYGALSDGQGHVHVGWSVDGEGEGEGAVVRLRWIERDGPPVAAPTRTGFGTVVMVRMAEASVDGSVRLDHAPEGVTWELVAPAARMLDAAGPEPT
ncbi:sensor histidine kinase [Rubellimicrobium roseum]|uniref:histidine kinase n=1 Tax=Rubellimicrobium roseum TaxID=687525 RepID=A0A5C4NF78_9RHOB|nr:sensor histidine kinase [Rubellimicrobium roseum]TNC72018.1 hypothetical protein FHG71_09805 [Rubellimicrobium roseum]